MALTASQKEILSSAGQALAASMATSLAGALATGIVKKLVVTNYHNKNLKGDEQLKPTEDETVLNKNRISTSENEAHVAHDTVAGQKGKVEASETAAEASQNHAGASIAEAQALSTAAGAMDVATKGMKLN